MVNTGNEEVTKAHEHHVRSFCSSVPFWMCIASAKTQTGDIMSDVARGSSGGRSTPSLERASCALVASTSVTVDKNEWFRRSDAPLLRGRSRVRRPP